VSRCCISVAAAAAAVLTAAIRWSSSRTRLTASLRCPFASSPSPQSVRAAQHTRHAACDAAAPVCCALLFVSSDCSLALACLPA
jgi:hypothetical protein